ncbi:phosphoenolpyruvate synthase [Paraflavitalea soli]|uniref:Phosphoenolpyruvate synthase n=1 Tax=Paraflavitalea soli TaxID=2315862 RepID=A0A3B7MEY0_9BACT|nr:phosphoenolpyruvate synthase [Paraflavitalea soli]AXY72894.1 phosphoenolpyruvate synthase [Paraflavitalea soli]
MSSRIIMELSQAGIRDIDLVGGKNASLGEMLQHLTPLGVKIPQGFIITVAGYTRFIRFNKLEERIRQLIEAVQPDDMASLQQSGAAVRQLISRSPLPPEMIDQISDAYDHLSDQHKQLCTDVAVRSSATAEDLPDASFAGQQDTYLNVRGLDQLLESVKRCFASLFTDRAISYRQRFGYDHFKIGLSVCVQKMVRADLGASGVAFSLDTESGFKDAIVINGAYGLGELVVQGTISPDEFIVFKPALQKGYQAIIEKKLGAKDKKMVYGDEPGERVAIVGTSPYEKNHFCLEDTVILQLSKWVMEIEKYYSGLHQRWCPMDVEWAVDGMSRQLYIVQARPETIHSRRQAGAFTEYTMKDAGRAGKIIAKGIAVSDKIASGRVRLLDATDTKDMHSLQFEAGDVLVTDMTDPDWEPIMKKASAIITNKGGRTCHAAIVAREMGVPAIVGCGNATQLLQEGQTITASCAEGETGLIYSGIIPFETASYDLSSFPEVDTPVLLNVASPDMAFRFASLPCKGIGLAREEFIINNYIRVHPLALLRHRALKDNHLTAAINDITKGYADEEDFFVQKLSQGVAKIAAAFYPHKVLVRFSDFKSNEYFNLLGGNHFEPAEENPMIGWRGASRYYSPQYKEAFLLECKAIKMAREKMGLKNIVVMIPFCRTVTELLQVYDAMKEGGLERGTDGLQVVLMAELPSNIIMARQFARHIDGFSIGSNDLTQLVLGLDRDSSLVAHIYDERNEAVKSMITMLIRAAREAGIPVGICGQGPSDFPDFAQFLVEMGIDSISVTPDSYYKTVKAIHSIEKQLKVLIA